MPTQGELAAAVAGRMLGWVTDPGLTEGPTLRRVPAQIAARSMALAYVAGQTGDDPAHRLAQRLQISPRQFRKYTSEASRLFGLRSPQFWHHSLNFPGRRSY